MCFFKVKTPSVQAPQVPASQLVPQTDAPEPESPMYGGSEDTFNKRKGRQQLTIKRNGSYNPTNY
jgi:hypothetical protein